MSILSMIEIDKISIMYEGDKKRDASSRIRGFLFQDYVTIMSLLQENVEFVCSEYLEDVDVFYEDGTFEFIQVKYYPNTPLDKKEVLTDLYYQYLRLQMLRSALKARPSLFIHCKTCVEKPTIQEMKKYIGLVASLPETVTYPTVQESTKILKDSVYGERKKGKQKETLFKIMASVDSIDSFIKELNISPQLGISEYKEKLMEQLIKEFPNCVDGDDKEKRGTILLGLAISYIQRRYELVDPDFSQIRFDKNSFMIYMTESVQTKTENTIVSYLVGITSEAYGDIISNNMLSDLQIRILYKIYQNTVIWIKHIAETREGQYRLFYTFSIDDEKKVSKYKELTLDEREMRIAECKPSYMVFLKYMWKIILNLCQEKIKHESDIIRFSNICEPSNYIDHSVTEYVCFNFPEDMYASHSVILPSAGSEFNSVKRKIVERMIKVSQKPGKWFFDNNKTLKGKNYYNYSTADVNENPTVADLGEDCFYIECMECIGIDSGEWNIPEICSDSIFSEKCVNGRKWF